MSCCGRSKYDFNTLNTEWTLNGSLKQNNYYPPDGWAVGVTSSPAFSEGFCCGNRGWYNTSSTMWSKAGNIGADNTNIDASTFTIASAPIMMTKEGWYYNVGTNDVMLKNAWATQKPYGC